MSKRTTAAILSIVRFKSGSLISPCVAIELDSYVGYFDLFTDKGTRFDNIMAETNLVAIGVVAPLPQRSPISIGQRDSNHAA